MARRTWASLAALATAGLLMYGAGCAATIDGDDGDGGNGGDSSSSGEGGGGGGSNACDVDCSTMNAPPCMKSVCNAVTAQCEIVPGPKGDPCDDGQFCTLGDSCKEGKCVGAAQNTCGMVGTACTDVECHEATHTCSLYPLPDGLTCTSETDLCLVNATCVAGLCKGVPKDCFFAPVPDVCHVGVCNPDTGVCDAMPGNDGGECPNDGDLCKVNKTCVAGTCQGGSPKDCSAFTNGCNNGLCDAMTGNCYEEPIPPGGMCLEATDECNTGICDDFGGCNAVPTPGVQCASGTDYCHLGTCDANGACVAAPANDGAACDDGNMCTTGETCLAGACQGGMVGQYVVYFSDTFASNAAGWTLGPEWQIAPAKASPGFPDVGYEDPGLDHTMTADNGIAGVVIGGYASTAADHAMYYLTSPAFDTNVMGPVYLEFWRFLNSDYTPFMNNVVEVYDGSAWQLLWESGIDGIEDSDWTHVTHDLTPFKNAAMQIRFGFDIQDFGGVFTVSSWNLDDVVVANAICN